MKNKSELNVPALFLIFILALVLWIDRRPESKLACEVRWEGIEKQCQPYQDWGYANGLAMPQRILGEQFMLASRGWEKKDNQKSCEDIVQEMYDLAHTKMIRPF